MATDDELALCQHIHHLRQQGEIAFAFPPATPEQVSKTEERIGFQLPSMLRLFYLRIANGAARFGSYDGLYGCVGGYAPGRDSAGHDWTIDRMTSHTGWRLDARVASALRRYPGTYVLCEDKPDRFILVGDIGCGQGLHIDGWTGEVYVLGAGMPMQEYFTGLGDVERASSAHPNEWMLAVSFIAPSLEAWLEWWMSGDDYRMAHPLQRFRSHLTPDMLDEPPGSGQMLLAY